MIFSNQQVTQTIRLHEQAIHSLLYWQPIIEEAIAAIAASDLSQEAKQAICTRMSSCQNRLRTRVSRRKNNATLELGKHFQTLLVEYATWQASARAISLRLRLANDNVNPISHYQPTVDQIIVNGTTIVNEIKLVETTVRRIERNNYER